MKINTAIQDEVLLLNFWNRKAFSVTSSKSILNGVWWLTDFLLRREKVCLAELPVLLCGKGDLKYATFVRACFFRFQLFFRFWPILLIPTLNSFPNKINFLGKNHQLFQKVRPLFFSLSTFCYSRLFLI